MSGRRRSLLICLNEQAADANNDKTKSQDFHFSATFGFNRAEDRQQREEADALIETVGLADVRDELSTSLPYGKQRRLEIVCVLETGTITLRGTGAELLSNEAVKRAYLGE